MNNYKATARGMMHFREFLLRQLNSPRLPSWKTEKPRRINAYRALRMCLLGHKGGNNRGRL